MFDTVISDEILTKDEAAAYCKLSTRSLSRWQSKGKGPVYIKVGRRILCRKSDLDAWLDSLKVKPVRS